MTNILRRLEIVEKELGGNSVVPEKYRIIVVPYPDGDEVEFNRRLQVRMVELRERYGPNISMDDFLIIGIRKFSRHAKEGSQS